MHLFFFYLVMFLTFSSQLKNCESSALKLQEKYLDKDKDNQIFPHAILNEVFFYIKGSTKINCFR